MKHLRDNGIAIDGSTEKRQLLNTGYYHGYKGYRFFRNSNNRIPFESYEEIYATIQYDSALKSLFYGKVMFIETAVKNVALAQILNDVKSENISDMYDKIVSDYKNAPEKSTAEQRKKLQQNKLNLQNTIQSSLSSAYKHGNSIITHFYNKGAEVPIWALFEIMMMGDFGYLLSCLTYEVRNDISKELGLNTSCDTKRELIYKYIYALKDLRNAIAHNSVIFDTRFRNIEATKSMKQCLKFEFDLPYINFETIGDYVVLIVYYLKILHTPKSEIKAFIRDYEKITDNYRKSVNSRVTKIVIHPELQFRMNLLKNNI